MNRYTVKMKCEVIKEVTVIAVNKDVAMSNPWDGAEDEIEIDQVNWEVISVKEIT